MRHGHILVNGKRVNIPLSLRAGDKIEIREKSRARSSAIAAALAQRRQAPQLRGSSSTRANFAGTFKAPPVREEMNEPAIREQYIVEYYSR